VLVATVIFAVLVALWGSPAVLWVVRGWAERFRTGLSDGEPGGAQTSAARDAGYEPPSGRPPAAA
jgi:hypothetical protein